MVGSNYFQVEEFTRLGYIRHSLKLIILLRLRYHILDEVDLAAVSYSVEKDVVVKALGPLGLLRRLQFEWTQQNLFELDGLAVDPGIGVVEFELVDASLGCHEVGPENRTQLLLTEE
jgi:hypothetical protein